MNYLKIYNSIIQRRKITPYTGYTETHHIIPRSLDGSDDSDNLVKLSAREHFVCHYLLVKINPQGPNHFKMIRAFLMMIDCNNNQRRYVPSKSYQHLREKHAAYLSETYTGSGNSQFGTKWISNPDTGISIKIPKDSNMPWGFMTGRNLTWKKCTSCEADHLLSGVLCSPCKTEFKGKFNTTSKKEKWHGAPIEKTEKICPICFSSFKVPPHRLNKKYCSLKCSTTNGNSAVARAVRDDTGVVFNTLTNAATYHKVSVETIRNRIKKGKYEYL